MGYILKNKTANMARTDRTLNRRLLKETKNKVTEKVKYEYYISLTVNVN